MSVTRLVTRSAALLDRLYDDASLFPPASLRLLEAMEDHARHRAEHALVTGPFVVPVGVVPHVYDEIAALAVTGPAAEVRGDAALDDPRVVSLELSGPVADALDVLSGRPGYVEVALGDPGGPAPALDALAAAGVPAKFRTGGTEAPAFPSAAALAAGITGCATRDLPFKLTAGLHDPARHRDGRTGFEHHGLLNVVLATDAALRGADAGEVAALLDDHDADALVDAVAGLPRARVQEARRLFRSVGTCSIDECLDGLERVGLGIDPGDESGTGAP